MDWGMTLDYDISVMRVGRKRRVHTEITEKEHREHGELDSATAVSADVRDGKAPVLKIKLGAALARVMSLEEIK
jgi:hypothetical protein